MFEFERKTKGQANYKFRQLPSGGKRQKAFEVGHGAKQAGEERAGLQRNGEKARRFRKSMLRVGFRLVSKKKNKEKKRKRC